MDNFDIFDQIVGEIFVELCEVFPVGALFEMNQIAHKISGMGKYDEHDLIAMIENTFDFLVQESFIVEKEDDRCYGFRSGIRLTLKGLAAVRMKPSSLDGESVGSAISVAVKEGAVDKIKSLVSDLISLKTVTVIANTLT